MSWLPPCYSNLPSRPIFTLVIVVQTIDLQMQRMPPTITTNRPNMEFFENHPSGGGHGQGTGWGRGNFNGFNSSGHGFVPLAKTIIIQTGGSIHLLAQLVPFTMSVKNRQGQLTYHRFKLSQWMLLQMRVET